MPLTKDTLAIAVERAHAAMAALADPLNAADAKLGDGDTGTMLARLIGAFAATDLRGAPDLGAAFLALAKAGAASTGSSLGTLIISALLSAGKATAGHSALEWSQLSPLIAGIRDTAMARGKAELGAKTIIDGLEALACATAGKSEPAELAAAANAAMGEVLEAFRPRPCTMGRARMFADKSVGLDDPGMLALAELVRAVTEHTSLAHARSTMA